MPDFSSAVYNQLDGSNTQPAPDGFPENIMANRVGHSVRALMGAGKRFYDRINPTVISTGAANVYSLTYAMNPASLVKGETFSFFAHQANTGAATFNIAGFAPRAIVTAGGAALPAGAIVSGAVYSVIYDGSVYRLQQFSTANVTLSGATTLSGTLNVTGATTLSTASISTASVTGTLTTGGSAVLNTTHVTPGAIELGIGGTGDRVSILDFHASGAPSSRDYSARAIRWPGVNGKFLFENTGTGAIQLRTAGSLIRNTTAHGYLDLGPQNASYAHISTDRPAFHFNKRVEIAGRLQVGHGEAASFIEMVDVDEGTRFVHNNSGSIGFLGSDGGWKLRVFDDGRIATPQFTDLNAHIEARASAQGQAWANQRLSLAGGTLTGPLSLIHADPSVTFHNVGARIWYMQATGGILRIVDQSGGYEHTTFHPNGNLSVNNVPGHGVVHMSTLTSWAIRGDDARSHSLRGLRQVDAGHVGVPGAGQDFQWNYAPYGSFFRGVRKSNTAAVDAFHAYYIQGYSDGRGWFTID